MKTHKETKMPNENLDMGRKDIQRIIEKMRKETMMNIPERLM